MIHWKRSILGLAFVIVFVFAYYSVGGNIAAKINSSKPIEMRNNFDKLSRDFINSIYAGDESKIQEKLAKGATYIKAKDGSSVIRFDDGKTLMEGYMSTDKSLMAMRQKWHLPEENGSYISSMEIYVKGEPWPYTINLFFTQEDSQWKVYMIENGI